MVFNDVFLLNHRQFADNIDKKSVGIERESVNFQSNPQQSNGKFDFLIKNTHQNLSFNILTVISLLCIVLFVFVFIQMSYWPKNIAKNHTYKRLNTLDDEDKLFSVKTEKNNQSTHSNDDDEMSLLKTESVVNSHLV